VRVLVTATDEGVPGRATALASSPWVLVGRAPQTITFAPPEVHAYGDPPFTLSASASSGLPLGFASGDAAVALVSEAGLVTLTGPGTVLLSASQVGDANWLPAPAVQRLLVADGRGFRLWLVEDGIRGGVVRFGVTPAASAGFDPLLDEPVSPGEADHGGQPYLLNPDITDPEKRLLRSDWRGAATVLRWLLVIPQTAGGRGDLALEWDVDMAAAESALRLQEVEDERPVGLAVDMKSQAASGILAGTVFEVSYARPESVQIRLRRGWNLVGTPLLAEGTLQELGGGGRSLPGGFWSWRHGALEPCLPTEPLAPEVGYWVLALQPWQVPLPAGIRSDGLGWLEPGWNLVSPAGDCTLPAGREFAATAWSWDADQGAYRVVPPGDALHAGCAYWLYLEADSRRLVRLGSDP
jgi:hypothetical protein